MPASALPIPDSKPTSTGLHEFPATPGRVYNLFKALINASGVPFHRFVHFTEMMNFLALNPIRPLSVRVGMLCLVIGPSSRAACPSPRASRQSCPGPSLCWGHLRHLLVSRGFSPTVACLRLRPQLKLPPCLCPLAMVASGTHRGRT